MSPQRMSQNLKRLYGAKLSALDGDIGHVKDFYFDDKFWVVRYLVVEAGPWTPGRQVLLSPHACRFLHQDGKVIFVNLTREQIEKSPSTDTHKTVSRQYEIDYYRHYGWSPYWQGPGIWGSGGFPEITPPPIVTAPSTPEPQPHELHEQGGGVHLRSTTEVMGYHIQTTDGTIGMVSGFLLDDKSWAISELVVEAGHWYSGKEILIATSSINRISYEESKVFVNLTKADIQRTAEHHLARHD